MPLDKLDWTRWFTDGGAHLYLHVYSLDGETIHRVFCRHDGPTRLRYEAGKLWWLLDCPDDQREAWTAELARRIDAKRSNDRGEPGQPAQRSNDDATE